MMEDTGKMMRDYLEAWNSHEVGMILSFFTEDCVYEDLALGTIANGKNELQNFVNRVFVALPDFSIELKSLFFSDEWVGYEWVFTGTPSAPPPGNTSPPPDMGKKISIHGASITELYEGKIKRNRDYGILPSNTSQ